MINKIKDSLSKDKKVELICIDNEGFNNSKVNERILSQKIFIKCLDDDNDILTTNGYYILKHDLKYFKIKEYSNVDDELLDTLIRKAVRLELIEHFNLPVDIIVNDNEEYKSFFDERYQMYIDKNNY